MCNTGCIISIQEYVDLDFDLAHRRERFNKQNSYRVWSMIPLDVGNALRSKAEKLILNNLGAKTQPCNSTIKAEALIH